MELAKIRAFAAENGYAGAETPVFVGPPLVILVQGENIRMSTVGEAYQTLDIRTD